MVSPALKQTFETILRRVVDWHTDGVRAHWSGDGHRRGPQGSFKITKRKAAESVELRNQGKAIEAYWRHEWQTVRTDDDALVVIKSIAAEARSLTRGFKLPELTREQRMH